MQRKETPSNPFPALLLVTLATLVLGLAVPTGATAQPLSCTGAYALCIAASCSSDFTDCPSTYNPDRQTCASCGGNCPVSTPVTGSDADPASQPPFGGACGYCYIFTGTSALFPGASVGPQTCAEVAADLPTVYSTHSRKLYDYAGFEQQTCTVGGAADCMGATCTASDTFVNLYNKTTQSWESVQTATCNCAVLSTGSTCGVTQGGGSQSSHCTDTVWSTSSNSGSACDPPRDLSELR